MKKKKVRVVDLVEQLFTKLPKEQFGVYELVDVEFVKEGKHRYLRVYIDKEDGVTIDDCGTVSQALNARLEQYDPIEEAYILEVSSPGIERPLKTEQHFNRFAGQLVQLKLYQIINGSKVIEGTLKGYHDGDVLIQADNTDITISIPRDKIAAAKLLFRF